MIKPARNYDSLASAVSSEVFNRPGYRDAGPVRLRRHLPASESADVRAPRDGC